MNTAGLSIGNAPPLSVPARYFVSAPLFGVLAAALLLWWGPSMLVSRWEPPVLAATHFLTLGTISMAMIGALSQMIPVLAGRGLRWPRTVAGVVHAALVLGTLLLGFGLAAQPSLFPAAIALLGLGIAVFSFTAADALIRTPVRNTSVLAMGLAVLALPVTAACGVVLVATRAGLMTPGLAPSWTSVHVGWGLFGWIGLLLMGVAYQVVPMFQITPRYPATVRRTLIIAVAAGVLGLTMETGVPGVSQYAEPMLLAASASFAVVTLWLQQHRRRRVNDTTLMYWRFAMTCLLAAVALRTYIIVFDPPARALGVLLGVLVLTGVVQAVINGMLYKIVPFLVWLHMRRAGVRGITMSRVVAERAARRQFMVHVLAVASLCAAVFVPELARGSALVYALANLLLGWHVVLALRYSAGSRQILDTESRAVEE